MNNELMSAVAIAAVLLSAVACAADAGGPPSYARGQSGQGPQGPSAGEQAPGGQGAGPRRGPPREAVAACSGKDRDAQCAFTTPRGDKLEGSCRQTPEGAVACVPRNRPGAGGANGAPRRMQGGAPEGGRGGMPPGGN